MGGTRVLQYKGGPWRLYSHSSMCINIAPMPISSKSEQLRDKHLIDMDQILRTKLGDDNPVGYVAVASEVTRYAHLVVVVEV
jgi:hypothetical protein